MSLVSFPFWEDWATRVVMKSSVTLATAEILSVKNERAWVSMVLYLKK